MSFFDCLQSKDDNDNEEETYFSTLQHNFNNVSLAQQQNKQENINNVQYDQDQIMTPRKYPYSPLPQPQRQRQPPKQTQLLQQRVQYQYPVTPMVTKRKKRNNYNPFLNNDKNNFPQFPEFLDVTETAEKKKRSQNDNFMLSDLMTPPKYDYINSPYADDKNAQYFQKTPVHIEINSPKLNTSHSKNENNNGFRKRPVKNQNYANGLSFFQKTPVNINMNSPVFNFGNGNENNNKLKFNF